MYESMWKLCVFNERNKRKLKNITKIVLKKEKLNKVNIIEKRKYIKISWQYNRTNHLKIEDYKIEIVTNFNYLERDLKEKPKSHHKTKDNLLLQEVGILFKLMPLFKFNFFSEKTKTIQSNQTVHLLLEHGLLCTKIYQNIPYNMK